MQTDTASADVAPRLDRLAITALHLVALLLCALGFTLALFEFALGVTLSAVFSSPPHAISAGQLSLLLASVYLGACIGSPLLGWCADAFGRRGTIMAILAVVALTSLGAGVCDGLVQLIACRALSGLVLGAYSPITIAYLTDLLPPGQRGKLIFAVGAVASLGTTIGVFLVRWLTPIQPLGIEAWRWAFFFGAAGAASIAVAFRLLPESPRWLAAQHRSTEAEVACRRFEQSRVVLALRPDNQARHASPSVLPAGGVERSWYRVALLSLLSPWATVAFPVLTGAMLAHKGFALSDTLLFIGLASLGPPTGALVAALVADPIERRLALGCSAGTMLLCGLCFVLAQTPMWLVVSSSSFGFFAAIYVSVLNVYAAELFPTASRARAVAGAWGLNRLGAALAPLLLVPLLHARGEVWVFGVIAVALLGSILLLIRAPRGRQLKPVL